MAAENRLTFRRKLAHVVCGSQRLPKNARSMRSRLGISVLRRSRAKWPARTHWCRSRLAPIRCLQCPFVTRSVECVHRSPKNSTSLPSSIRRIIAGEEVKAFSQKMSRRIESCWRMIEFLAQMPTDTKIFPSMAVQGLATVLGLAYSPSRPF
jgi:hypothetical protein